MFKVVVMLDLDALIFLMCSFLFGVKDQRRRQRSLLPLSDWTVVFPGGGWQDQVGGLMGGVNVGRSRASLPLRVEVEPLSPPKDFLVSLEQHLLLVYTGKTRLARNLLQVRPSVCCSLTSCSCRVCQIKTVHIHQKKSRLF